MYYYSTRDKTHHVSLTEAVLQGLPPDNGLYMPQRIPELPAGFFSALPGLSFVEIALAGSHAFFGEDLKERELREIVEDALNFDIPLKRLDENLSVLELFHGPTLAFKDVGARFMARMMQKLIAHQDDPLHILVATSGDTGSAVAQGFYGVEGIEVIVLYPSGKISRIQEQQIATLDKNIRALEVDGTFDDCQRLVKGAFLDKELRKRRRLSSANSINIARLLPQSFYYFYALAQLPESAAAPLMCVPSGNLGNLTAGLIAKRMGLPLAGFVSALNSNDVFGAFLRKGVYNPRASKPTLSNAMDVGDPSNLGRIREMYWDDIAAMRGDISAFSFDDDATLAAIREMRDRYGYVSDPHGAVGYLALQKARRSLSFEGQGIFLETAHPAKFGDSVKKALGTEPDMPQRLKKYLDRKKTSHKMPADFEAFKEYLY